MNQANLPPGLAIVDNCIFGVCGDSRALLIQELLADGRPVSPMELQQALSLS